MDETATTAIIICRDDAHGFLLETVLDDSIDRVIHLTSPLRAIQLVLRGLRPDLVLIDVDLFDDPEATAEAAARLRVVCKDAVVLEVGERVEHSGADLAARLRGNSVEAHDWLELRR